MTDHRGWLPGYMLREERIKTFDNSPFPGQLAKNGFYYTGDEVRCIYCGIRWKEGNDPTVVHMSYCYYVPVHAHYASEASRLKSFAEWPRSKKPDKLAEAGFFYTGQGDKTKCFYCDGGLEDWEEDDEPWEEHARWFGRCAYVRRMKGREYIQKVKARS
ncbi:IAP-3 [Operophtera brumata nucleopolyhedrovirus]|uniref:IAP-3 n=1 Tax=Operophtera brumata nucleopolyhedrovirus TaxID=1046267 RepID=A0A2H4UZR2_9ABAC|nr:IAP-3 [Operophtera brumata nucleopolyhedrovirus]AUA60257.1 IAP-3 [Operophtera brumata nucleopolyhedrovirus]